ncbi:MAG: hypothetical protein ACYSWP_08270 [Planctomycetota bacterium]
MDTTESKVWYKSKTMWFNGIVALLIVLQTILENQGVDAGSWLDPEIVTGITVIVNLILRMVTKQPITTT